MERRAETPKRSGSSRHRGSLLIPVVILALLITTVAVWQDVRAGRVVNAGGIPQYIIFAHEYDFVPQRQMVWTAGERIILTMVNQSDARPGKVHTLTIGREPLSVETTLGESYPGGFEQRFFKGVDVRTVDGEPLDMSGIGMEVEPGESRSISFVVPDRPGTWVIGCFAQSGQHWRNGMLLDVTVRSGSGEAG